MKKRSLKQKLTLWITLLMLLLTGSVLAILISVSSSVAVQNACTQLESTLRANLAGISKTGSNLAFGEGFTFSRNGVYTLVYSSSGALLAGQPPLWAPEDVPFSNESLQTVPDDGESDTISWISTCPSAGTMVSGYGASYRRPRPAKPSATSSASFCYCCR